MALKFYNSLTNKKETFKPLKNKEVKIYSCGPTVYQFAHLGNLRTYIFGDLLRRTLEYLGYKVKQVMNVTDVGHLYFEATDTGEDKIEKTARALGKTAPEIADFYLKTFLEDLKALNIKKPHFMPKATEHIKEQIDLIKLLEQKGFTYKTPDGIYFDTSQLSSYPRLIKQAPEEKKAGARVKLNPYKKNQTDFALWKLSPKNKKRQLEWESPWGKGFPGWHLECSAMAAQYLGIPFDIHTGGIDLRELHHPNEIAQTEAATGKILARFWLHSAFLTLKNQRMGKSKGNLMTLKELEKKGFKPLDYRLLVLQSHYRKPLEFSFEALESAKNARQKLIEAIQKVSTAPKAKTDKSLEGHLEKLIQKSQNEFNRALENDLNAPKALAPVFQLVKTFSSQAEKLSQKTALVFAETFQKFNQVLAVVKEQELKPPPMPTRLDKLLQKRETLRTQGQFQKADEVRKKIQQLGWKIEDTPTGPRITPLSGNPKSEILISKQ
jgi:cysteinyl-tRNA synthetase